MEVAARTIDTLSSMDATLQQLRVFLAVANELHFGRAAEHLHMTQPPVTRHVKALEAALGVQLFDRTSRNVMLTTAGELVKSEAGLLVSRWEALMTKLAADSESAKRLIRLGCVEAVALELLPEAIGHIETEGTYRVDWQLREGSTADLLEDLRSTRFDVVAIRGPVPADEALVTRPFYDDFLFVALPAMHALATGEPVALQELSEEHFIVYNRRATLGLMPTIRQACQRAGFIPRLHQDASGTELMLGLVKAGNGVAVVSSAVASIPRRGITFAPIDAPPVISPITMVWRADHQLRVFDRLVAILRQLTDYRSDSNVTSHDGAGPSI